MLLSVLGDEYYWYVLYTRAPVSSAEKADLSARVLASDSITLLSSLHTTMSETSLKVIYFVPISQTTKSIQINPDISILKLVTLICDDNKETLGATTPEIYRVSARAYAYCTAL